MRPSRSTAIKITALAVVPATMGSAAYASGADPAPEASQHAPQHAGQKHGRPLDLGPKGLPEHRTVRTLEPGVTLTQIVRGQTDPNDRWAVEATIPSGETSPDPDAPAAAIQDRETATDYAAELSAAGFPAKATRVEQPEVADIPAGTLGWRVRLTQSYTDKPAATATAGALKKAGFSGRVWFTGWDGDSASRGPWTVNVLTIDPKRFDGTLGATYGADLENRETPSVLAKFTHSKAVINAGFFVLDPAAGAEGDPAGAAVYDGRLASEPVGSRPVLVLDRRAQHTQVVRPTWRASVKLPSGRAALDGINRVPGLIRNCGGTADDLPTAEPRHDVTCTDADEFVLFTPDFGASTPSGDGAEAVLSASGKVLKVSSSRGVELAKGQRSLQGIGSKAAQIAQLRPGQRVDVRTELRAGGHPLTKRGTSVVNGGPELTRNGRVHITQRQDGMSHPDNPSFAYGWVLQRNPRTLAGVDRAGRTMLVTVDGRQTADLGLSIPEAAAVARSLGMVDSMNLDGGGSTAMVSDGQLITHPSDAAGERPVGDAIFIR